MRRWLLQTLLPQACFGWESILDLFSGSSHQISASMRDSLNPFLGLLPHDTSAAVALGRTHDDRLRAPAWLEIESRRPMRHAFEIRHKSFLCHQFIDLLRDYNVALVYADTATLPQLTDVTSDFVYCRLRSLEKLHVTGHNNLALDTWARRINAWASGNAPMDAGLFGRRARVQRRDVFIFFDDDKNVRAPANAMELIRRLRL